jgi:hypothetical protein
MSYFDLIIKYLSGDLKQEDSTSFEKELESNVELKTEFEEVSAAYSLIRDQLQIKDLEAFRKKLVKAMDHEAPQAEPTKHWFRHGWYVLLVAACSLALLLIIPFNHPDNEKILSRYFDPMNDPVVLTYNQNTRGEPEAGIHHYSNGNYNKSMELISDRIREEGENQLLQLYYLLSAIELDRQDEVLELISIEDSDRMLLTEQAISWYSTMALLKSGKRKEALEKIHPLTEQHGPYQSDALKLEKVLLK